MISLIEATNDNFSFGRAAAVKDVAYGGGRRNAMTSLIETTNDNFSFGRAAAVKNVAYGGGGRQTVMRQN
jgi:hypothetical protein